MPDGYKTAPDIRSGAVCSSCCKGRFTAGEGADKEKYIVNRTRRGGGVPLDSGRARLLLLLLLQLVQGIAVALQYQQVKGDTVFLRDIIQFVE